MQVLRATQAEPKTILFSIVEFYHQRYLIIMRANNSLKERKVHEKNVC